MAKEKDKHLDEMEKDEEDYVIKFNNDDFFDVDYDEQNIYFRSVQSLFTDINSKRMSMDSDEYYKTYQSTLESVASLAVTGNIPCMDYLCFLYKRGIDGILDRNLTRAHEWGLLAMAAGSKLAIERLRLFVTPVFAYVIEHADFDKIIKKNKLKEDEVGEFVAYSFANVFNEEMGITLKGQSKKPLNEEDNFQMFTKNANDANVKCLPKLLELIS